MGSMVDEVAGSLTTRTCRRGKYPSSFAYDDDDDEDDVDADDKFFPFGCLTIGQKSKIIETKIGFD